MKKLSLVLSLLFTNYLSHASTGNIEDEQDDEFSRKIRESGIRETVNYRKPKRFYSSPQQPREDTLRKKFLCRHSRHNPATSSIETTLLKEDPNSTER